MADTLPQNIEAEIGVLGSLLLEDGIAGEIIQTLDKSYFSTKAHQLIFEAVTLLFDSNKPIDPVTVQEELRKTGALEHAGGEEYIVSLMETVFSAASAPHYAQIVREKGIMRKLVAASEEISRNVKSGTQKLDDLLDKSEQLIFDVTQSKIASEPAHINNILMDVLANLEKSDGVSGVPTGFYDLDQMISGLQPSTLIIIAGRPSMGKTTFSLNVASQVAIDRGVGVLIFSLEMAKEQLAQNIICSRSSVSPHKITNGTIDSEDYAKITAEAGILGESSIFIDDTPGLSIRELRAKARRHKSRHGLGLIIIDYIQLMEGSSGGKSENRQQEISQISRGLKGIARELSVPVIGLSQLNRSVDSRDDHRPRMSDLRESGALEQDADLIMFLYRDEYYNRESPKQGIAEVIVAKHRNGPTGAVELYFYKQYMRFVSLASQRSL